MHLPVFSVLWGFLCPILPAFSFSVSEAGRRDDIKLTSTGEDHLFVVLSLTFLFDRVK